MLMARGVWLGVMVVTLGLLGTACTPKAPASSGKSTQPFAVLGALSRQDGTGVPGARVGLHVDRDRSGALEGDESSSASSDGSGRYRVELGVLPGERVVLSIRADGLAPVFRSVFARPGVEVEWSEVMVPLERLVCEAGACAVGGGGLSLNLPDAQLRGAARAFDPLTEREQFPGGFEDSDGNLLVSGVFGAVELTDAEGRAVRTLSAPAELSMRLPGTSHSIVTDVRPGTARIEVPLYAFDEVSGTWVREEEGYLTARRGEPLAEVALSELRGGGFSGELSVVGAVGHFSFWNLDFPVSTRACVTAVLVDAEDEPLQAAAVEAYGLSYTGVLPVRVSDEAGRVCLESMRSERPGEDLDLDGTPGEVQSLAGRVLHGGRQLLLPPIEAPADPGTCATSCLDLGRVNVEGPPREWRRCLVSGRVLDKNRVPLPEAQVQVHELTGAPPPDLCGGRPCEVFTRSAADGAFALEVAFSRELSLTGLLVRAGPGGAEPLLVSREGTSRLTACPSTPVELVLDGGFQTYGLSLTLSGGAVAWTPALKASRLTVREGLGGPERWEIESQAGFSAPVAYGSVPSGAAQTKPPSGAPLSLSSGDVVEVMAEGLDTDGYKYQGTGLLLAP